MKKLSYIVICALSLSMSLTASLARAQADDVVCPAVIPCDEKTGEILAIFNVPSDPCFPRYQAACASLVNNRVADQLVSCSESNDSLSARVNKLELENKRLKSLLRRSKR